MKTSAGKQNVNNEQIKLEQNKQRLMKISIDAKLVDRKQTAKIESNQFKTHVVRQKVDGAHVLSKTRSDRCM